MTEQYPWQALHEDPHKYDAPPPQKSVQAQPEYDPHMFVRLRIQHGASFKLVGIRADDSDITGKIPLDDGSEIVISLWGVPTATEPFMKCDEVMKELISYVRSQGRTIS